MKLCRCPVCHTDLHLDALVEDASGAELLALIVKLPGSTARHLVAYLGLFRPEKSNLSNARALKLAGEVFDLYPAGRVLADALEMTVQQIRQTRIKSGASAPLSSHGYLRKVYETSVTKFANSSTVEQREREQGAAPVLQPHDAAAAQLEQFERMGINTDALPARRLIRGANHEQSES
ncbi:hypothetical protein [Rahnella contaminans]|uniref:hypothetical protein n=1 Tax=Rahnella contaminans TaxID=2703882 RepID=UPI003C3062B1